MKIPNPYVFLSESGKLMMCTKEVPEEPVPYGVGDEQYYGSRMDEYRSALSSVKASAVEVRNEQDIMQWLCTINGYSYGDSKDNVEKTFRQYNKHFGFWQLNGYVGEVKEGMIVHRHEPPAEGWCAGYSGGYGEYALISPLENNNSLAEFAAASSGGALSKSLDSVNHTQGETQEELWKELYMDFDYGEGWIAFTERMKSRYSITRNR